MDNIAVWRTDSSGEAIEEFHIEREPQTLDEATALLPSGGYTTFRTFGRFRVLRMESHFDRLEETARLAGKELRLSRDQMKRALFYALSKYSAKEMRVRMIVDLELQPGMVYILVASLHAPEDSAYQQGVRIVTLPLHRNNPKAKLTSFINTASVARQDLPAGINEAVMIGADGCCLEGLSSNFFAIKDGIVWTAEEGVLSGITRALILEIIHEENIPLKMEGIHSSQLPHLDEAFISSASRAVLPVTEIDGRPVGSGQSGPISRQLLEKYLNRIEADLVDLRNFA